MSAQPPENATTNPWQDLTAVLRNADQARTTNDVARAYTFYRRATELDPNDPRGWLGRAMTTTVLDDAILSWAYDLALAPADVAASAALDQRIAEKIAQTQATEVGSLIALGRAIAQVGLKSPAYHLFKRATELDDRNEAAWLWRAGLTRDKSEAISCLNQVLALNPANSQAQSGLEWALAQQRNAAPARTPTASEDAGKLVEQGRNLLRKGDKARAYEFFKRATELDQTNEQAWLWRGGTTTDVDEALTCMERALALDSSNQSAREARSWLRVRKLRSNPPSQDDTLILRPKEPVSGPVQAEEHKKPRGRMPILLAAAALLIILAFLFLYLRPLGP